MYIKEVELKNVRSVQRLHMKFPKPAGWHVLLGENGSGKSSVIRAVSAALVGPSETLRLDPNYDTWVTWREKKAQINLVLQKHDTDKRSGKGGARGGVKDITEFKCHTIIEQSIDNGKSWKFSDNTGARDRNGILKKDGAHPDYFNWGNGEGWFSAAFGPYRRFNGGNQSLESFYVRNPKIGAHLTAFKEDAALTESVVWLKDQLLRSLSSKTKSKESTTLEGIKYFINQEDFLPPGFRLEEITPDGPFFSVPGGYHIHLYELSEGIKSVTSLAFELLRLLVDVYGADEVFGNYLDDDPDNNFVPVPGIVMIDEIDVHLHPAWQARIGFWFTRSFPKIQFIVSTHSAIVCRAAINGSIWRLPLPGSNESVQQVTGTELDKLLYGDILDAFGTNAFGINMTRSLAGYEKMKRLAELNVRYYRNEASTDEISERAELIKIFPTDDSFFS